ncbi:MAG: hypothetical protein U0003_01430 [Vampirovibrionales bacterium]
MSLGVGSLTRQLILLLDAACCLGNTAWVNHMRRCMGASLGMESVAIASLHSDGPHLLQVAQMAVLQGVEQLWVLPVLPPHVRHVDANLALLLLSVRQQHPLVLVHLLPPLSTPQQSSLKACHRWMGMAQALLAE